MSNDPRLRVSPDVVSQDLGDGLVLLNLRTGIYWGLNRTGAVIWRGIENRVGIDAICGQLREEFNGADAALETNVHNLLSELVAERLILEATPADREAPKSAEPARAHSSKATQSAPANNAGKLGAGNKRTGKKISRDVPKK